jgi:outer membrane protein assembly factor BamB
MKTSLLVLCAASILRPNVGGCDDWPQWRGPSRTGHAANSARAPTALPGELKPVWRISCGGGHAGPVVAQGKVALLDEHDGQETAHLLDAATGREIWSVAYAEAYQDEWGAGPRSTPILEGDRLYVQSCRGEFRCLNLANGQTLWAASFEKDFGVKFLGRNAGEGTATRRGNNGSGVIEGDRIILPVGSVNGASLVCFDKRSGKVLWKSGNDEAAYSSFIIGSLAGMRQVVAFTGEALLGADLGTGRILWRVPFKTNAKRHAATPVIRGDHVIVNSHTIGMVCLRITQEGAGLKATEAWANKDLRINLSTPVLVDQSLYCQGATKDYICVDAVTGKLQWSQPGFGPGVQANSSAIAVGKSLLVLNYEGTLHLLAANPEKYTELGRLQVCGKTWSHPAYADGMFFVRDSSSLLCLKLESDLASR